MQSNIRPHAISILFQVAEPPETEGEKRSARAKYGSELPHGFPKPFPPTLFVRTRLLLKTFELKYTILVSASGAILFDPSKIVSGVETQRPQNHARNCKPYPIIHRSPRKLTRCAMSLISPRMANGTCSMLAQDGLTATHMRTWNRPKRLPVKPRPMPSSTVWTCVTPPNAL